MAKKLTEAELKRKARKKRIRKRRFFVFLIFLMIAGIGVFYYLLQTKLFPVKKVAASGSELYSAQEIVAASGITPKTPIMTVTKEKVEAKLQKKLPYIESVQIKRTLPDAVKITVTDAKETFLFKEAENYFAVSENMRVLAISDSAKKGLVSVTAKDVKLKAGKSVTFKNSEDKELLTRVYSCAKERKIELGAIDISNTGAIKLKVSNLYEVNLGSDINITEKFDQLEVMIKEIGGRKGKINLGMWSKTDSKGTFIPEK